ncbi:hypothetical protein HMPREF1869_00251, partial [Bacteroidales bacterium KA00251]
SEHFSKSLGTFSKISRNFSKNLSEHFSEGNWEQLLGKSITFAMED